jgi:hypothetical protein
VRLAPITLTLRAGSGLNGTDADDPYADRAGVPTARVPTWIDFDLTGTFLDVGRSYAALLSTTSSRYGLIFGPDINIFLQRRLGDLCWRPHRFGQGRLSQRSAQTASTHQLPLQRRNSNRGSLNLPAGRDDDRRLRIVGATMRRRRPVAATRLIAWPPGAVCGAGRIRLASWPRLPSSPGRTPRLLL